MQFSDSVNESLFGFVLLYFCYQETHLDDSHVSEKVHAQFRVKMQVHCIAIIKSYCKWKSIEVNLNSTWGLKIQANSEREVLRAFAGSADPLHKKPLEKGLLIYTALVLHGPVCNVIWWALQGMWQLSLRHSDGRQPASVVRKWIWGALPAWKPKQLYRPALRSHVFTHSAVTITIAHTSGNSFV